MASLAPTLTAFGIRERCDRVPLVKVSFDSTWGNSVALDPPLWQTAAFSAIAKLECQRSKAIPGLGELAVSAQAANALRAYLLNIDEPSLPFPRIVPAAGGTILLFWESGGRSIEIAAFSDGDVVLEALNQGVLNEPLSAGALDAAIRWLVRG